MNEITRSKFFMDFFLDNVKKEISKEYLTDLITAYINSDVSTFKSENGTYLFNLFRIDENSKSNIDVEDSKEFYSALIADSSKFSGLTSQELLASLNQTPGKITIDTNYIFHKQQAVKGENKISLNIAGKNLYDVITKIYKNASDYQEECDFYIEIPDKGKQSLGYRDSIIIYASNEHLKSIVFNIVLNDIVNEHIYTPGSPIPFMATYDNLITYDTYSKKHGKWMSRVLGEAIISSIDSAIMEWALATNDPMYDVQTIEFLYKKNEKLDAYRANILKYIQKSNFDIISIIYEKLNTNLIAAGIDLKNPFVSENVINDITTLYKEDEKKEGMEESIIMEEIVPEPAIEYAETKEQLNEIVEETTLDPEPVVPAVPELAEKGIDLEQLTITADVVSNTNPIYDDLKTQGFTNLEMASNLETEFDYAIQNPNSNVSVLSQEGNREQSMPKLKESEENTPIHQEGHEDYTNYGSVIPEITPLEYANASGDVITEQQGRVNNVILTAEEIAALQEVTRDMLPPSYNEEMLQKYSFISTDPNFLLKPIYDNNNHYITLYEYLENNDILNVIPLNSTVITEEGVVPANQFIRDDLVNFLINNGNMNLKEYLEMYKIQIKVPRERKNTFFRKILGSH